MATEPFPNSFFGTLETVQTFTNPLFSIRNSLKNVAVMELTTGTASVVGVLAVPISSQLTLSF